MIKNKKIKVTKTELISYLPDEKGFYELNNLSLIYDNLYRKDQIELLNILGLKESDYSKGDLDYDYEILRRIENIKYFLRSLKINPINDTLFSFNNLDMIWDNLDGSEKDALLKNFNMVNNFRANTSYYVSKYNWNSLSESFKIEFLYKLKRLRIILLKTYSTTEIRKSTKESIYEELYEDFIFQYSEPLVALSDHYVSPKIKKRLESSLLEGEQSLPINEFITFFDIRTESSRKLMGDDFDELFFEMIKENLIKKHYGKSALETYKFKKFELQILEFYHYDKTEELIIDELKPQIYPLRDNINQQIKKLHDDLENIEIDRLKLAEYILLLIEDYKTLFDDLVAQSRKIKLTEYMVSVSKEIIEKFNNQRGILLRRIEDYEDSFFINKQITKEQFISEINEDFDLLIELKKEHAYLTSKDFIKFRDDIGRINKEIRRIEKKYEEMFESFYFYLPSTYPLLLLFNTISQSASEVILEPCIINGFNALQIKWQNDNKIELNNITIKDLSNTNLLSWNFKGVCVNSDDFIKMIKTNKSESRSVEITSKETKLKFTLKKEGFPTIFRSLALLDCEDIRSPYELKRLYYQNYIECNRKTLTNIFNALGNNGKLIEFKSTEEGVKIFTDEYDKKNKNLPFIEIPYVDFINYEINEDFDITFSYSLLKKFKPTVQKIANLLNKNDPIRFYLSNQKRLTLIPFSELNLFEKKEEERKKYLRLLNLRLLNLKNLNLEDFTRASQEISSTYNFASILIDPLFYHLNSQNEILFFEQSLKIWWNELTKEQRKFFSFLFDKKIKKEIIKSNWEDLKEKIKTILIDYLKEFIWEFSTYFYLDKIDAIEFTYLPLKVSFEVSMAKNMPLTYEYYLAPRVESFDDEHNYGLLVRKNSLKFRRLSEISTLISQYFDLKNSILSLENDYQFNLPNNIKAEIKTKDKILNKKEYLIFRDLSEIEGLGEQIEFSNQFGDLEISFLKDNLFDLIKTGKMNDFREIIYYNKLINTLLSLKISGIIKIRDKLNLFLQDAIDIRGKKPFNNEAFLKKVSEISLILRETLNVSLGQLNNYILYLILKKSLKSNIEFKDHFNQLEEKFKILFDMEKSEETDWDLNFKTEKEISKELEIILIKNESFLEQYNLNLSDFGMKKKEADFDDEDMEEF